MIERIRDLYSVIRVWLSWSAGLLMLLWKSVALFVTATSFESSGAPDQLLISLRRNIFENLSFWYTLCYVFEVYSFMWGFCQRLKLEILLLKIAAFSSREF